MAQRKPLWKKRPLFGGPAAAGAGLPAGGGAVAGRVALVGSAVMLNYKLRGEMPQQTVLPADLTTESFAPYSSNQWWTPPDDDPDWYLSTDSDPHIYWQGQGYIETVKLYAGHRLPPGGVALYYLLPGQTDYSETQKVYATVTEAGEYTFDLGGRWVTGLRIGPPTAWAVCPPSSAALS